MNRGLYALAGVSATADAAACAKRFEEPITKVSKVYLLFRRESSLAPAALRSGRRGAGPGEGAEEPLSGDRLEKALGSSAARPRYPVWVAKRSAAERVRAEPAELAEPSEGRAGRPGSSPLVGRIEPSP